MHPFPRLLTFVAGAAAGIAFLAYCGGDPNANANTPDAGGSTTCDCPAVPDTAVTKSGTRLKAKVLTSTDGARILTGWYDSERQEDCAPRPLYRAGDEVRCYPDSNTWSGHFSDPQCSVRAILGSGSGGVKYIRTESGMFKMGQPFEGFTYQLVNEQCAKSSTQTPGVMLGDEVPLSSFVALSAELR